MNIVKLIPSYSHHWFFNNKVLINYEWEKFEFGFNANSISIINDNSNNVYFSFDGIKTAGLLKSEESIEISQLNKPNIYLKGAGEIRIWAY